MTRKSKKRKAKAKAKFESFKKTIVRHIYGLGDNGQKKLLYSDEIVYTIANERAAALWSIWAFQEGQELLSQKIKLEMWDKDDIAKTRTEVLVRKLPKKEKDNAVQK